MEPRDPGPLRLMPSDPAYEVANDLWDKYAILLNPQVWMNQDDLTVDDRLGVMNTLEVAMNMLADAPSLYVYEAHYQQAALLIGVGYEQATS